MVNEKEIKCPSIKDDNRPKISDFWTKKDKNHHEYCQKKNKDEERDIWTCSEAEGCRWEYSDNSFNNDYSGKCVLNSEPNLGNVYINGGIGFGKLCLDNNFTRLIILIIYPPLFIYIKEREKVKNDSTKASGDKTKKTSIDLKAIIMCFVYTCAFYFPGLIYGLYYHFNGDRMGCFLGNHNVRD